MLYGSICLSSTEAALKPFPQMYAGVAKFHHTSHPQRGLVQVCSMTANWAGKEVHLPQRSKSYQLYAIGEQQWCSTVVDYLAGELPKMESQHEQARQLFKLNEYMKDMKRLPRSQAYVAMLINNGDHAHVGLLSQWNDLNLIGVYDSVNSSVRLVWTDDEYFVTDVRNVDPGRYVFYRFPMLVDRPLFLYSQALCSKWSKWMKTFGSGPDAVLKAFNSLELFLYKEPELPTLKVNNDGPTT